MLDDCLWVVNQAKLVKINDHQVAKLAERLVEQGMRTPDWSDVNYWQGSEEETAQYVFLLDNLNFCFWGPTGEPRWTIEVEGKKYQGWYGLVKASNRDLSVSKRLLDSKWLAQMSLNDLQEILADHGELQLMEERLENLRQMGQVLGDKYEGQFAKVIKAGGGDALRIVQEVVENFENFRDEAVYAGRRVRFYKRAQHLVADSWGQLEGKGLGQIRGLEKLTSFPDDDLPQILRHFGVLEYDRELSNKIDNLVELESGSKEEVEIRASTVVAVEKLRQELEEMGVKLRAMDVDVNLWILAQQERGMKQGHRVRGKNY